MRCERTLVLLVVLSGLWASQPACTAQSIENFHAEFTDQKVIVSYDLNGNPSEKYRIQLYGSHNNFSAPLRLVSGAVGDNITSGKAKTIEWHVAEELVTFRGQITFRLRGEIMAVALSLQSPAANSTIRTGKKTDIKWSGGSKSASVKLELMQDGKVVNTINEGSNVGIYSWSVPKDMQKGAYNLRISTGSESMVSGPVVVKSPWPLWVKLSPIVVAGVVVFLLLPDDPETPDPPVVDPDLPSAPRPN